MCVPYKKINFDRWTLLSTLDKTEWQDAELVHVCNYGTGAFIVKNKLLYTMGVSRNHLMFQNKDKNKPELVTNLLINDLQAISTGFSHGVLLDKSGLVCAFGQYRNIDFNSDTMSTNNVYNAIKNPQMKRLPKIVSVCCSDSFVLALDINDQVWYWGRMDKNQITIDEPKCLIDYSNNVCRITAGRGSAALLDRDDWLGDKELPVVCINSNHPNNTDVEISDLIKKENKIFLDNTAQCFNSKEFSDIELTLSEGKIFAHKLILSSKSQWFCRLIHNEVRSELNLSNHSSIVVTAYLKYLYSGCPEAVEISAIPELYCFAKNDNKEALLLCCDKTWNKYLKKETSVSMYVSAMNHDVEDLIKPCAKYIVKNMNEIALTSEFKALSAVAIHKLFDYGLKNE